MESIILMNSKWGNDMFVPMYLFFGGLSGGLFVVAVAADLIGIKLKQFENFSKVTVFCVCLFLHWQGPSLHFTLESLKEGYYSLFSLRIIIHGW